jgi:hypothetical protein
MTIIFLAYKLPDPISDELARHAHSVYECLAISEVFAFRFSRGTLRRADRHRCWNLRSSALILWFQAPVTYKVKTNSAGFSHRRTMQNESTSSE